MTGSSERGPVFEPAGQRERARQWRMDRASPDKEERGLRVNAPRVKACE
jgi:hypothetical protein